MKFLYHRNKEEENFLIMGRIFLGLAVVNIIDCLLTVIGVQLFGMVEYNPFFYAMSGKTVLLFILVKLLMSAWLLFFYAGRNVWWRSPKVIRWFVHYVGFISLLVYMVVITTNFFLLFS